jgi:hypothetical protein
MLPECFNLLDPGILFLYRRKQLISAGYSFIGHSFQIFVAVNVMLLQEEKRLGCLLQVEALRPALIACSLA